MFLTVCFLFWFNFVVWLFLSLMFLLLCFTFFYFLFYGNSVYSNWILGALGCKWACPESTLVQPLLFEDVLNDQTWLKKKRVESTEEDNKEAGEFLFIWLSFLAARFVYFSAAARSPLSTPTGRTQRGFRLWAQHSLKAQKQKVVWPVGASLPLQALGADVPLISSTDIKDDNVRGQNPHRC